MKIRVVRKKVQWIDIEVEVKSVKEAQVKADDGDYDNEFAYQESQGNYSADYSFYAYYTLDKKPNEGE